MACYEDLELGASLAFLDQDVEIFFIWKKGGWEWRLWSGLFVAMATTEAARNVAIGNQAWNSLVRQRWHSNLINLRKTWRHKIMRNKYLYQGSQSLTRRTGRKGISWEIILRRLTSEMRTTNWQFLITERVNSNRITWWSSQAHVQMDVDNKHKLR